MAVPPSVGRSQCIPRNQCEACVGGPARSTTPAVEQVATHAREQRNAPQFNSSIQTDIHCYQWKAFRPFLTLHSKLLIIIHFYFSNFFKNTPPLIPVSLQPVPPFIHPLSSPLCIICLSRAPKPYPLRFNRRLPLSIPTSPNHLPPPCP